YDQGDCLCEEDKLLLAPSEWDAVCQVPRDATVSMATMCRPGCHWAMLGDGRCDSACNLAECAYDVGDCLKTYLNALPALHISVAASTVALLDDFEPVVVVNTSVLGHSVTAKTISGATRRLVKHHDMLFVFLAHARPFTIALLASSDLHKIEVVPMGRRIDRGYWYAEGIAKRWADVAVRRTERGVHVHASFPNDVPSAVEVQQQSYHGLTEQTRVKCSSSPPKIPGPQCLLGRGAIEVIVASDAARTQLCFESIDCIVIVEDAAAVVASVDTPRAHSAWPRNEADCGRYLWCSAIFDSLDESCGDDTYTYLGGDPKTVLTTICVRSGANTSDLALEAMTDAMCQVRSGTKKVPAWVFGCRTPPPDLDAAPLDMFGASLQHVNRLYTAAFGHPKMARGVPSHMPHFIQKRLFRELKAHWAQEFDETSAHRFRHPRDMQFAFSYMHYITNRRKLHPPTSVAEVFHSFVDVNHNGVVDDWEVDNIAALLGDATVVNACTADAPWTLRQIETDCAVLAAKLAVAPYVPAQTRVIPYAPVLFAMLRASMDPTDVAAQLQVADEKFVCINDDMEWPDVEVWRVVAQVLRSRI
ncbi:N-acetylglucosamine-1-phosphotransferase subunits alpha/beta, partial [Achlya hypogyna]